MWVAAATVHQQCHGPLAMPTAGSHHVCLLCDDGSAVAIGSNRFGQCDIPVLREGLRYTQVAAGGTFTVLLCSDGTTRMCGFAQGFWVPLGWDFPEGTHITQLAAGYQHIVAVLSDGEAKAVSTASQDHDFDYLHMPKASDMGAYFTQAAAGFAHTVLLCSDGQAIGIGSNSSHQLHIPALHDGRSYVSVSASSHATGLVRSDGSAIICGLYTRDKQCVHFTPQEAGVKYTQLAICGEYAVLLRSDGTVDAFTGSSRNYSIPMLSHDVVYTQCAVGYMHNTLLRSDGTAITTGWDEVIPDLPNGRRYVPTTFQQPVFIVQLFFEHDGRQSYAIVCRGMAGDELARFVVASPGWSRQGMVHASIRSVVGMPGHQLRLIMQDGFLSSVREVNYATTWTELIGWVD